MKNALLQHAILVTESSHSHLVSDCNFNKNELVRTQQIGGSACARETGAIKNVKSHEVVIAFSENLPRRIFMRKLKPYI